MLALATMLPAMAENWTLASSYVNPYEDILTPSEVSTNPANYTLYLMWEENTNLASVKKELEGMTFTEFTTTLASGDRIAFVGYDSSTNQLHAPTQTTTFDTNTTPTVKGNMWGVCVYQHEDDVLFQVLPLYSGGKGSNPHFSFDTKFTHGSGYTSFSSVPEPATATLSLLALAALAARRKRR